MTTQVVRVIALSLLTIVAAGCSTEGGRVVMTADRAFKPETIHVRAGDEIVFVNESQDAHTVTAEQGALPDGATYFASGGFSTEAEARARLAEGLVDPGAEFSITLDTPGAYPYVCIPHESQGMTGVIVVQ